MISNLREIQLGKEFALNRFNLDKICALKDFYKAYEKIKLIYEKVIAEEQKKAKASREIFDIYHIDKLVNAEVREVCDPLVNKHRLIFGQGPAYLRTNRYGFDSFTILEVHEQLNQPLESRYTYRLADFDEFLEEFQFAVTKVMYYKVQKKEPDYSFKKFMAEKDEFIERFTEIYKEPYADEITDAPLPRYSNLNLVRCHQKNHPVVPAVYHAVSYEDGQTIIRLPVLYCERCKKYYISKAIFNMYLEDHGDMIVETYLYDDEINDFSKFQKETKLHRFGYNVVEGGMSEEERRRLLLFLIDHRMMSYEEIISTINQDILMFEDRPTFYRAIDKWRSDLKYLGDLVLSGRIYKKRY